MKIRMTFLCGIIISVFCLCDAMAGEYVCPAGCFCIDNGNSYPGYINLDQWCGKGATKIEKGSNRWNMFSKDVTKNNTELDELYMLTEEIQNGEKTINIYGVKGDVFYEDTRTANRHVCPMTHPHSEKGSKAITDCFYTGVGGKKIYYTFPYSVNYSGNCDMSAFARGLEALQQKLAQANELAQDLQNALDKVGQATAINTKDAKTAINAGVSGKLGDQEKKKTTTGKSMRSPSTRNNDLDAAKAMISAGI